MARRRRYSPEQVVMKLREAEVVLSQGQMIVQACKTVEISEQTLYRRRRVYGGMDVSQAKPLRELEKENASPPNLSQNSMQIYCTIKIKVDW